MFVDRELVEILLENAYLDHIVYEDGISKQKVKELIEESEMLLYV